MMRRSTRDGFSQVAILGAALLLLGLGAGAARAAPPVWHVHGPHGDITLFGSVHLLADTTEWKTPALEADLAQAQALWFEIPVDAQSQAEVTAQMQSRGLLPPGQTLASLLSADANARLARVVAASSLPLPTVERFKPWLADLMLTVLYAQQHGAQSQFGVEQQISHDAPPTVVRGAFETVSDQIDLFADQPQGEQVAGLDEDLREIGDDPGQFDRIAAAWARGDVQALIKEAIVPMKRDTPGLYDALLVQRNRRFTTKIEQMLQGSQRIFVTVGVAHLVGPDSVVAMLRRDKIVVDGP